MKREKKFYLAILIIVAVYIVVSFFIPVDPFSKRITTVTALISAVAFWLQFKRSERLNESNFIMNLNNQFISNKDMTMVEHELELYYNQFLSNFPGKNELTIDDVKDLHLGISQSRTNEQCQKLINYLVYLESLAALVENQVIHINVIDDLFSYRFFLAVNNPVVQYGELLPYSDFYQGIFSLSEKWLKNHRKRKIPIPMEQFCLTKEKLAEWKHNPKPLPLDISLARGSDSKTEIARCIYNTDSYIYPEAFGDSQDKAEKAISRIIGMDGSIFDYRNITVARYNGEVCGICIIRNGNEKWNTESVLSRMGDALDKSQVEGFKDVSEMYFGGTESKKLDDNEIELVACCVDDGFRRKSVARKMLAHIIENHRGNTIRLTVLEDNVAAIKLYEKSGFIVVKKDEDGYAPKGLIAPKCFVMRRESKITAGESIK